MWLVPSVLGNILDFLRRSMFIVSLTGFGLLSIIMSINMCATSDKLKDTSRMR